MPVAAPFGPAATPEPKPYSVVAESTWNYGAGVRISPSGEAYEPYVGGGDILSRFEWNVAGSIGLEGEASGGGAAIRWRGLRGADLLARGYYLDEKPGEMDRAERPERDLRRGGGELALEQNRRGDGWASHLAGGGLIEQLDPADGDSLTRRLGWLGAGGALARIGQDWGAGLWLEGSGVAGQTGDESWQLGRAEATVRVLTPAGVFSGTVTEGEVHGDPSRFDLFTVGGGESSIRPAADGFFRSTTLALPEAALSGERFSRRRVEWGSGLVVYGELLRAGARDASEPLPRIRVAGIELSATLEDFPIRLGGKLSFSVGVAKIYDEPLRGSIVGYGGLTIRP